MSFNIVVVSIELATVSGPVKARADVRLEVDAGAVRILGIAVIETEGKGLWVALPQKPGKNGKRYFPVVEIEGALKDLVAKAVLDAYERLTKQN